LFSQNALLTNAAKPDVIDVTPQAQFYFTTSIFHFSGFEWDGRYWHKNWHFPSYFKPGQRPL